MKNKKSSWVQRVLLSVLLVFCVLSLAVSSAHAAGKWENTYGGDKDDRGFFARQTADGGFIATGITHSKGAGGSDVYLLKTDAEGAKQWEKAFGDIGDDIGNCVQQTKDGGYIIAGVTDSYGAGKTDVYLIKTNSNGSRLWQRTFGGAGTDWANFVQQTSDGGYIIVGGTDSYGAGKSDVFLIKTDPNGKIRWKKTFGGTGKDIGSTVQQTTDGGFIIVGRTESYGVGKFDVLLIKTDASGNKLWQKTFGGQKDDYGYSVQQTKDGGYIIAGCTYSYGTSGSGDVYLIKTDDNGNKLWHKTFGGKDFDEGRMVQQTTDGGYIITGHTSSYGDAYWGNVYLIKTDTNGGKLWQKVFGGTGGYYDYGYYGYSVQTTTDGGYIIGGYAYSYYYYYSDDDDVYLIKTDAKGNAKIKGEID